MNDRASATAGSLPVDLDLPVVMFHGVCDPEARVPWHYPFWLPLGTFEEHLRHVRRRGYATVHLDEAIDARQGRTRLPGRALAITFDDALLDNWVYAFPLLERHHMKATIFVPTDFVAERGASPPNLGDVHAGRVERGALQPAGSLSWTDLQAMSRSGLVSIQSHGKTHTWYPVSGEILDFCHPGTPLTQARWLIWNRSPEAKSRYYEDLAPADLPLGRPILRHELSLAARRFLPAPGIEGALEEFVREKGGVAFFERRDWRELLLKHAGLRDGERFPGRVETDEEFRQRLVSELQGSRELLEERLGTPVRHFAWPNGGACAEAIALLAAAGYRSATVPLREDTTMRASWNGVARLPRFSGTMMFRSRLEGRINGWALGLRLKAARGSRQARLALRVLGRLRSRLERRIVASKERTLSQSLPGRRTTAEWRRLSESGSAGAGVGERW